MKNILILCVLLLSAVTISAQKAEFEAASPELKAYVMYEQVNRRVPFYSGEQRAVLEGLLTKTVPTLYGEDVEPDPELIQLTEDFNTLFAGEPPIFLELDTDLVDYLKYNSSPLASTISFCGARFASLSSECGCNSWNPDNDCGPDKYCFIYTIGPPACERTRWGCGVLWFQKCDGVCRYIRGDVVG